MKNALIIFVRHPQLGKVKTRLAATLGNEAALAIYQKLLLHTKQICEPLQADKFIFYSEDIVQNDIWNEDRFFKMQQTSADLGSRMHTAFEQVFQKGYNKVCIIGSDCFELTTAVIEDAFQLLSDHDVVIGPAKDGGYYLLGMKTIQPALFNNKQWSTSSVCTDTINSAKQNNLEFAQLPVLTDVDEATDVPSTFLYN